MRSIEVFRLRRSPNKPRALAVIAARSKLAPPQALTIVHAALAGERPCIVMADDAAARACIEALAPAGFVARFAPAGDFDAAEHAQSVLASVLPLLPRAVAEAVGALLLRGESLLALDHALQHMRMHHPVRDAARALLERTAIEVGLVVGPHARA